MPVPLRLLTQLLALIPIVGCHAQPAAKGPGAPLALERTIPLGAVAGRIDHLAIDVAHHRLFIAELGAGSVEAVDISGGAPLGRIGGLKEPQGLAYLPGRDALVVASGGDGTVRFYRAGDLAPAGVLALGKDADNVHFDPHTGNVVIGYGSGALAAVDPASRGVVARLALPAHPEGFAIQAGRVFVNVPDARRILAGGLAGRGPMASWIAAFRGNFPMALAPASNTLAVVFRSPPRLQVLDAASGAVKADKPTCGDADDVFFDSPRHRLYVVCGVGAIDVFETVGYARTARIATRAGARTGLFVPELDRLFVAARADAGEGAAIFVFRPRP